jgi:hypothetical protein
MFCPRPVLTGWMFLACRALPQSSMQAESKLHDEVVEVCKAVKLLCAQYHIANSEMRQWMEAINAFDQYGHGFISTEQVGHATLCAATRSHLQQAVDTRLMLCAMAGRWCVGGVGVSS